MPGKIMFRNGIPVLRISGEELPERRAVTKIPLL
jgi:hypothetical protein